MNFSARITGIWLCCGFVLLLPRVGTAESRPPPLLAGERDRWAACVDGPSQLTLAPDTGLRRAPGTPTTINADFMEYDAQSSIWELQGDVELDRADQHMRADAMRYDQVQGRVDARGGIRYEQTGLLLGSRRGHMELARDRGELESVEYLFPDALVQGVAGHVRLEDGHILHLTDATYSTCEPGNEFWNLRVSRMRLNQETGTGEAWHARLAILGLPVAYVPYLNFPIDDRRKTGLLPPTLGQSTRSGTDIALPFYWNIAPEYDLTLTPRYLSRRGPMLESEFRYLRPSQSGELRTAWLPDDDEFGDDRWSLAWDHRARVSGNVRGDLTVNRVSDDEYFRDFGNTLSQSSQTHLPSQARLRYNTPDISSSLRARAYQTVDPDITSRPYERLPQVRFDYRPESTAFGPVLLQPQLDAEAVRFDHPEPQDRTTGVRLDMTPRLSLPVRRQAGYIRPSLAMRLTSYDLERDDDNSEEPESISRAVPIASLDTGLYFDRYFTAFDRSLWQTLEPRLFYLYVPARDQGDIPRFDTGRAEPSLFQLFSEDRFVGADRVGDANQVTLGLTSRLLDRSTGAEYFRMGIGQAYYFADREVTLSGRPPGEQETRERSDIIGEIRATLPAGFQASSELHWNPEAGQTSLVGARLNWQPEPHSLITAGYRSRRENDGETEIEQANIAAVWPLGQRWHALGGWRYSLDEERTLESFGGLEYRDCCWSVRLVNRYYREEAAEEAERSIMLQFEFRGLASVGEDLDDFLEDAVYGYRGTR